MTTEEQILRKAYDLLLSIPLTSNTRVSLQATLCAVRDEIARLSGQTSEEVQTEHEARVGQ